MDSLKVSQNLIKRKWTLALNLCFKESINKHLSENLLGDVKYEIVCFIEELKNYDDLFIVEEVDVKKTNKVWDEAINSLIENSFSTRHQIVEFMILVIYKDDSLLNINEIICLLNRLQIAEDRLLNVTLNLHDAYLSWNIIVEFFSRETFSTDQEVLEFFDKFTNKFPKNVFLSAWLQIIFILCPEKKSPTSEHMILVQPVYDSQQVLKFLNKFANGIGNLDEAENQIYDDKSLRDEEKIYLYNYLQIDYKNDLELSIFNDIKRVKKHMPKCLEPASPTKQIIPNKLQLLVYSHSIDYSDFDAPPQKRPEFQIACWTFLSRGLSIHRQKEIYFTLRRNEDENEDDFPINIKVLYHAFYILACKGSTVDIGEYSYFDDKMGEIIFSRADMNKIIYTERQPIGIDLPSHVLHAILITNEEYEVYMNYGISRLLSQMGNAERYFPFPPWNDRLRESVVTMNDMKSSILNMVGIKIINLEVRVTCIKNKTIRLNISPNTHESICKAYSETEFQYALTILTGLDRKANSCLVWDGNLKELNANGIGCLSSRLGGCFDGFVLFLTNNTFQHIHQALISRNYLNIRLNENTCFVLEWDHAPKKPIIVKDERNKKKHIVELTEIELLTSESKLDDRMCVPSQIDYISEIDHVVLEHFSLMDKSSGFNLSICFTIEENETVHIELRKNPLDYDDSKLLAYKLWHSLSLVNLPIIYSGPVSFQIHFAVWGGIPESYVWPKEEEGILSTEKVTFSHGYRLIGDTEENVIKDEKEKLDIINEKAEWHTGYINEFNMAKCQFERASSEKNGYVHVILKRFSKSINGLDYLLYELKQYRKISGVSGITRCFGVTRRPETGEYLLVVEYSGIDLSKLFNNSKKNL
ncbi:248_t:CDS:2 [Dentiscutata heterogama]|uniref:248_t:CDS:1 n=1 Tax=Dentiscutata heterogama TaxID=1316150 RepID=A0ACA9KR90_9GLOM|nr:248_t:CDS:2 [Dentiscutata heterogama]